MVREHGLTIGRSSKCDIVISDPRASREHARIVQRDKSWVIADLGTSNGTFVDGQRITEAELRDGGRIQVADMVMTFHSGEGRSLPKGETTTGLDGMEATVCTVIKGEGQTSAAAIAAQGSPEKMVRAVEAIESASRVLHSARSPDELFEGLTRALMKAYPECECCHALTWDAEAEAFLRRASHGRFGAPPNESGLSSTAVHRAIQTREALVCVSTETDPDVADAMSVRELGIRSFACAPILRGDRPLGAIYLDSRRSAHALSEGDLRVLSVIANEAALALHNMELLEHYVEKQRMAMALELARDIQANVLPDRPPSVPGFQIAARCIPCDETSGDYYDFIELPDGKLGIAIGDVTGHGIGPALLMMSARSRLQALALSERELIDVFRQMNGLMLRDARGGMFIALFYAVLDPATSSLTYLSAGHEPGLLYRASSGQMSLLPAMGCPLGIVPDMELDAPQSVEMATGDILFLCTDGVTEAANSEMDILGRDRLIGTIIRGSQSGAETILEAVLSEVEAFRGGAFQSDDVTVVVVKAR